MEDMKGQTFLGTDVIKGSVDSFIILLEHANSK